MHFMHVYRYLMYIWIDHVYIHLSRRSQFFQKSINLFRLLVELSKLYFLTDYT